MTNQQQDSDQCCPEFNPASRQEREFTWRGKKFIRDSMPQLFHMPIPGFNLFGKTVGRMWKQIEYAGAKPDQKDFLMLAYDPSPWRGEIYINVTKEVPGAENTTISGKFITRVYDGGYNEIPKWFKDMEEYLAGKKLKAKKYYVYYTTCPKCAKKFGHNYVVMFAQVG